LTYNKTFYNFKYIFFFNLLIFIFIIIKVYLQSILSKTISKIDFYERVWQEKISIDITLQLSISEKKDIKLGGN